MFNLDNITSENNKEHNKKWPYIPDHPCKIWIIGGSGSEKTNALLKLIKYSDSFIDKIYLYAKDLILRFQNICKRFENLQNESIKVWSALFKMWKQILWTPRK